MMPQNPIARRALIAALYIFSMVASVVLTLVIMSPVIAAQATARQTAVLAGHFGTTDDGEVTPWQGEVSIGGAGYGATMSPRLWDNTLVLPHPSQPVTVTVWLEQDGSIKVKYDAALNADPASAQAFYQLVADADWSATIRDLVIERDRAYLETAHLRTCAPEGPVGDYTCRTASGEFAYRYQYYSQAQLEEIQRSMPIIIRP